MTQSKTLVDDIFSNLAHAIRRKIIKIIHDKPGLTYTEILRVTGLDTGTLNYHLSKLEKFYIRINNGYYLSEYGNIAIKLMSIAKKKLESSSSFMDIVHAYLPSMLHLKYAFIMPFKPSKTIHILKTVDPKKFFIPSAILLFMLFFDLRIVFVLRNLLITSIFLAFLKYNSYVLWELKLKLKNLILFLSLSFIPIACYNVFLTLLTFYRLNLTLTGDALNITFLIVLFWSIIVLIKAIAHYLEMPLSRSFILVFLSLIFSAIVLVPIAIFIGFIA